MATYTYNAAVLATSDKDVVRMLIGDTDDLEWLMADEEIDYILTLEPVTLYAAARCCDQIATKFGRMVDTRIGSLSLSASQKSKRYTELAATLRHQGARDGATPIVPAISIADKMAAEIDEDRVPPKFTREMMRNRYARPPQNPATEQQSAWTYYP